MAKRTRATTRAEDLLAKSSSAKNIKETIGRKITRSAIKINKSSAKLNKSDVKKAKSDTKVTKTDPKVTKTDTKVSKTDTKVTKTDTKVSKTDVKVTKKKTNQTIRGRPKSGRIWKMEKKRFSSIIKVKGIKNSLDKKRKQQEEVKRVRDQSRTILDGLKAKKEQVKERRRENLKRQRENAKKSEVVQVITNTSKLRRLKKKQMRNIEKRDTSNL